MVDGETCRVCRSLVIINSVFTIKDFKPLNASASGRRLWCHRMAAAALDKGEAAPCSAQALRRMCLWGFQHLHWGFVTLRRGAAVWGSLLGCSLALTGTSAGKAAVKSHGLVGSVAETQQSHINPCWFCSSLRGMEGILWGLWLGWPCTTRPSGLGTFVYITEAPVKAARHTLQPSPARHRAWMQIRSF